MPWIAPDEMTYGLIGQSLYRSGSLDILGGPTPYFSALVPAFVGLPLSLGDLALGYDVLKVMQALAMSLTAVPVYLWGRSLVGSRGALVAAALTLAVPGLVYSGLVMTEVLFYPAIVLVAWATARAIQEPTGARQALVVGAVALAVMIRLQALVLVPAVLAAYGLDAALSRSANNLRRSRLLLGVAVLAFVGLAAAYLSGGGSVLGGYDVVARRSYDVAEAARFVLYHAASLTILAGVIPVCALLVLAIAAARRGEPDPAVRAYLAVAVSFSLLLVLEVGVFASRYVGQLAERDLIGLAPILFLGLVIWIERGAPRSFQATAWVALAVATPLALLPLGRLVTSYAPPDAPTLTALYDLRRTTSLATLEIVFFVGVGAAILVFALVPAAARPAPARARLRRARRRIGGRRATGGGSGTGSPVDLPRARTLAGSTTRQEARSGCCSPAGPAGSACGSRCSGTGGSNGSTDWTAQASSARCRHGRSVCAGTVCSSAATARCSRPDTSSRRSARCRAYPHTTSPGGWSRRSVGRRARWEAGRSGAWSRRSVSPPGHAGVEPNGDIYASGDGHLVAFGCHPGGSFLVTLLIKEPQTVTILRNGAPYRRLRFRSPSPNQPWRASIPTRAATRHPARQGHVHARRPPQRPARNHGLPGPGLTSSQSFPRARLYG